MQRIGSLVALRKRTSDRELRQNVVRRYDVARLHELRGDDPSLVAAVRNQSDQMTVPRIVANVVDLLLERAVLRRLPFEVDPSVLLLVTTADRFDYHSTGDRVSTAHSNYSQRFGRVFAVLRSRNGDD